jgi:glycosyltransferase involved in cell wall biosynthesis
MLKACLAIPVYNHSGALASLLEALRPSGLPCILVDDASEDPEALDRLVRREASWVRLVRHACNQGKGAAVMTGAREAFRSGYTHLLQIDADGQHSPEDVPRFLAAAAAAPAAVICGVPIFDASAPDLRRWGRLATNVWIWINTLSFEIADGLCGFRIYPLAALIELDGRARLGRRMDFDPGVLVQLKWRGLKFVGVPTRVRYPPDGRSHFKLGVDNWLISRMHARSFAGMLRRLPSLLADKFSGGSGPR